MHFACVRIKSDRVADASRVLVSASRRNDLSIGVLFLPWKRASQKNFGNPGRLRRPARPCASPEACHKRRVAIFKCSSHNGRVTVLVERYAQMRDTIRVRERALFVSPRIPSELELQARWFAEISGKPARLQLQLRRNSRRDE